MKTLIAILMLLTIYGCATSVEDDEFTTPPADTPLTTSERRIALCSELNERVRPTDDFAMHLSYAIGRKLLTLDDSELRKSGLDYIAFAYVLETDYYLWNLCMKYYQPIRHIQ